MATLSLLPGCQKLTAAHASQISDGASCVLVASERAVKDHGLSPRARVHHVSVRADDPIYMLTAPIPATRRALEKTGMKLDQIDAIEINEAFASVVLAWEKELHPDMARVNPNGGAIALGHPIGATGARITVTLLHEMARRGARLGVATLCVSGGMGTALLVERAEGGIA
jgi:acetyl-CoA C-acetyltransferase